MKIVIDIEDLQADEQTLNHLTHVLYGALTEFVAVRCTEYAGKDYVARRYPTLDAMDAQAMRTTVWQRCRIADELRAACAHGVTIEE